MAITESRGQPSKPPAAQPPTAASRAKPPPPLGCDTFVALPPATADGSSVLFAKNSDRTTEEVQEVVAFPAQDHPAGASLRCTYISIPQARHTHAVVLSKPTWMYGCEMGANEMGVVCGNEAVWTVEDSDGPRALLGMDLVRLALERGSTAAEGVDVITSLLEEHGQGGPCEEGGSWTYHNSFLVADASEAWVLETAGRCWVAQRITEGVRNISNCLSIRTSFDRTSPGLLEYAKAKGHWDGEGDFDWAAAFSDGGAPPLGQLSPGREASGHRLLQAAAGKLDAAAMMHILRDSGSGICMCDGAFRSNGSQVSQLSRPSGAVAVGTNGSSCSGLPAVGPVRHWFTATPDPSRSIFKPFSFPSAAAVDNQGGALQPPLTSPYTAAAPAPRNPPHALWTAWQGAYEQRGGRRPPAAARRELESRGLDTVGGLGFAAAVEEELRLYGAAG